jgi:hypothetical protein
VDAFLSTGRFPDTLKRLRLFKEAGYQTTNLALRVRARSSPLPDHTGHSVHLASQCRRAVEGVRPSASHRRIRSWWDRYLQSRWRAVLSPHCLCESSAKRIPSGYGITIGAASNPVLSPTGGCSPISQQPASTHMMSGLSLPRERHGVLEGSLQPRMRWTVKRLRGHPAGTTSHITRGIPSGKDPHVLRWLDSRDSSYRRHPACTRAASEVYPERKPERIRLRSSSDPLPGRLMAVRSHRL